MPSTLPPLVQQSTPKLPQVALTQQLTSQIAASSSHMGLNVNQQTDQQTYQQVFSNHNPISSSVSVQNLSTPQEQNVNGFQHSISLDETAQNQYNFKKLPENLNQILER